ncbi:MAG: hypothetical protein DYH20_06980 [Gammaproteobacteria bacterium PRO9]|nr:hypothetical protein [Gammaproteobacteria bacterium PRO9]
MGGTGEVSAAAPARFEFPGPLLPDYVRLNARWYPAQAAVIDEQATLTWQELDRRSNAVANGLLALGVGRGDSVAILLENCVEYVEILYGIWKAGAVTVPLNLAVPESGLKMMLNDAAARVLFCSPAQRARVAGLLGEVNSVLPGGVIVHEGAAGAFATWRDGHPASRPPVTIGDEDPCNIIYSSGTTALPKGIKHLHRRPSPSLNWRLATAITMAPCRSARSGCTRTWPGPRCCVRWPSAAPASSAGTSTRRPGSPTSNITG